MTARILWTSTETTDSHVGRHLAIETRLDSRLQSLRDSKLLGIVASRIGGASSLVKKLRLLNVVQRCHTILLFKKYMNIPLQYTRKPSRFYSYSKFYTYYSTLVENLNLGSLVYFLYFEQ